VGSRKLGRDKPLPYEGSCVVCFPTASYVSLGSLAELETQLLLSRELGFLKNEEIDGSIERIRKMLLGLIKHLKGKSL